MLVNPSIVLDTNMSVSDVLARLACHGYWLDPHHPAVQPYIERIGSNLQISFEEAEQLMQRPFTLVGAAIRRQWYANIMWYARTVMDVLFSCNQALADDTLLNAMNLHEPDSKPPIKLSSDGSVPQHVGVVVDGDQPVAVSLNDWGAGPPLGLVDSYFTDDTLPMMVTTGLASVMAVPINKEVRGWPRVEAPSYVPASKAFSVVVGLAAIKQAGVIGEQVVITPPKGATFIDVTIELIADGMTAKDGWSKMLRISTNNPTDAAVTFELVGLEPAGSEPVHLTMLEVRYIYKGSICGNAWRPIVIGCSGVETLNLPNDYGMNWLDQPATGSAIKFELDPQVADLTIEISKPDANPSNGSYICRLISPHPLTSNRGPFLIDLENDAQAFAKSIVDQVRVYSGRALAKILLEGNGRLVADKLGPGVMAALREVAGLVAPKPPAVLLISAEPYVPWELAVIDPPLDSKRPMFLGAQVMLGRWINERASSTAVVNASGSVSVVLTDNMSERPPIQPPAALKVKHMAVMAGVYQIATGMRRLPKAEDEVKTLSQTFDAVALDATEHSILQLIEARLEHKSQLIGGAEAVHFAGHGNYDPNDPASSMIYLSDGIPLYPSVFRAAKYGGDCQPLIFLNACMIGQGGQLLGAMGGFPGNCLKGGFGGVLGALWEVDDTIAHDVALEFWRRALKLDGSPAEPVGEILRDLRANFARDPAISPEMTYLAYVFYGHPRLTLQAVH